MSISLKKILESKKTLTEEIVEPSEQILKGAMACFKQQTGIVAGVPTLVSKSKRTGTLIYEISMNKELRTPAIKAIFKDLTLKIVVDELENVIGGYIFVYTFSYTHPSGGSNGVDIGTVYYKNNKFIGKF